jgi:hypothetical protein
VPHGNPAVSITCRTLSNKLTIKQKHGVTALQMSSACHDQLIYLYTGQTGSDLTLQAAGMQGIRR